VAVAFLTGLFWRVHHDGDRKAVILAGVLDQALPIFGTNIGRVDNGQLARRAAFRACSKRVECIVRACLVILVVADEPAEEIDESTSVGRKCPRASVDLLEPEAPISATRANSESRWFSLGALPFSRRAWQ